MHLLCCQKKIANTEKNSKMICTYNPICTTAHMPHQFTSIFKPIIITSYYIPTYLLICLL